jgi:uncharacterized protein (DUF1778 family)
MKEPAYEDDVAPRIVLTPEESERFAALSASPPPPNLALLEAMERFRARMASEKSA